MSESIGDRVRTVRTAVGLTQESLARLMATEGFNWPAQTVVKIEKWGGDDKAAYQRRITLDEGVALAKILGVSPEWIATGEEISSRPVGAISILQAELVEARVRLDDALRRLDRISKIVEVDQ